MASAVKLEITIMKRIPGGYDTWPRRDMGVGTVCNQFDRTNKRGLRELLTRFIRSGDELMEWERKPGEFIVFAMRDDTSKE